MSAIQTDVSPAGMKRAVEENWFAACRAIFSHMPDVDYQDGPELMSWVTGLAHPLMNGVSRPRLTQVTADAQIAETIALFRAKGVPALWWYDPSPLPTDLGQRLLAHGFNAFDCGEGTLTIENPINNGRPPKKRYP